MEGQPFPEEITPEKWWKNKNFVIGITMVLIILLVVLGSLFVFDQKEKNRVLDDSELESVLNKLSGGSSPSLELSPQEEDKIFNSLSAPEGESSSKDTPPPSDEEKKKVLDSLGS